MEEIWKEAKGYEDYYEVSNLGQVRDKKGNILPQIINCRYYMVYLKKPKTKHVFVHRLIALTFVPGYMDGLEVNHKDENRFNNRFDNLEWCTHKYNCNYGTRIKRIKEKQNIPVLQYTLDGKFIAEHASMHIAAEAINADAGHICDCCLGNRKWAYGYFWRYKDDSLYEQAKIRIAKVVENGKKSRREKFQLLALNVVQLDLKGNYIQTFQSSRLAAESVGSYRPMIINCCNGKVNHVKGYKWMYERDFLKNNNKPQQLTLF